MSFWRIFCIFRGNTCYEIYRRQYRTIAPYEGWVDEDQFTLLNTDNDKIIGYYGSLEKAITKVSRLSLANSKEDYTLAGFIESYNNIKDQLTQPFKQLD